MAGKRKGTVQLVASGSLIDCRCGSRQKPSDLLNEEFTFSFLSWTESPIVVGWNAVRNVMSAGVNVFFPLNVNLDWLSTRRSRGCRSGCMVSVEVQRLS